MEWIYDVWTWVAACVVFAGIGEALKRAVRAAHARKDSAALRWYLATLPVHPLCAGLLLACVPGIPVAAFVADSYASKALYFGSAGIVSVFAYDVIRTRAKYAAKGGEP